MRIIQFFLVAAVASLGCTGTQPLAQGVEIAPEQSELWNGNWMTADSSLEDNIYYTLEITEANERSFTYDLEDRVVPYGHDVIWSRGTAYFRNALEAVDYGAERTFVLRVDPEDRLRRIIETEGVSFLFYSPGPIWEGPAVDWPAPPATETTVTTRIEDDHGDSQQMATPIGSISNTPGFLTSGDVDYFRIDLSEPATLQIWTSGDVDTFGNLRAGDGSLIATDIDSGPGMNFEIYESVRGGTYFIQVRAITDSFTGSYTLHVRPMAQGVEAPATDSTVTTRIEDDHGDSRQTATPIGSNSNTAGILTSGDVDYFRVDFSEGANPWIWTSGGVETLGVVEASSGFIVAGGPDWNWWDFDPTVTVNFPMNHVNFGPNEYIDEGTYFIRVAGYADYSTGSYTLHVRPTPVRPTLMRPTPVRPAERLLGIYFGGWYAEHVNEDGELEQWEIVFDERSVAVSGTFNMVVRNSAEDRTQIARSEQTRVTGDYNHPVVVLYGTNTIASDPEETAECMFGGVMESNGDAIIGGLVCEADGENIDRHLRFLRTYG